MYSNIEKQFKLHVLECVIDSLDDYEGATDFNFITDDEIYSMIYYSRCNHFINESGCNVWDVISFASELYKDMTGEAIPTDNINSEFVVNFIFNHYAHILISDLEHNFNSFEELNDIKKEVKEYLELYEDRYLTLPF
tara:strand:+ start:284 stop:694 length:411 start_codon:yes stop_codon:yes gene_type:complete